MEVSGVVLHKRLVQLTCVSTPAPASVTLGTRVYESFYESEGSGASKCDTRRATAPSHRVQGHSVPFITQVCHHGAQAPAERLARPQPAPIDRGG